jgi:hypothetical protein
MLGCITMHTSETKGDLSRGCQSSWTPTIHCLVQLIELTRGRTLTRTRHFYCLDYDREGLKRGWPLRMRVRAPSAKSGLRCSVSQSQKYDTGCECVKFAGIEGV